MTIDWDAELSKLLDEEEHRAANPIPMAATLTIPQNPAATTIPTPSNRAIPLAVSAEEARHPSCPFTLIAFTGTRI